MRCGPSDTVALLSALDRTAPKGGAGGLLADEVRLHRAVPATDLAAMDRGAREHPAARRSDPRQQPPLVLRLVLHAGDGAAQGHVPGQGGVLHHSGAAALALPPVLLPPRPGAPRP